MTPEFLSAIAAGIFSLVLAYVPGVAPWFEALPGDRKRAVVALTIVASAAIALALSCWQIMPWVECTRAGAIGLGQALVAALLASQATYTLAVAGRK